MVQADGHSSACTVFQMFRYYKILELRPDFSIGVCSVCVQGNTMQQLYTTEELHLSKRCGKYCSRGGPAADYTRFENKKNPSHPQL